MRHIGILKPDTLVSLLNNIGLPAAVIYFFSMIIFPCFSGDWGYVQDVWDRWQSLNVGMLAFTASITAFNISRFNANKQRERDFLAAKAFLPAALSQLCVYFTTSAKILTQAWEINRGNRIEVEAPILPEDYKVVFGQCIRYAESDVGDYLSTMLVRLQIHDSRLNDFVIRLDDDSYINPDKYNIISYLYRLAELQAFVNKLFGFARSVEPFDNAPLEWEDFRNALSNMDVWIEDIFIDENMNLEAFTKRAIDRNDN